MLTRREFLGRGAAGASGVSLAGSMPALLAQAAVAAEKHSGSDRVLVVVELAGGNDGLNTLVPIENDLYYRNRPTLAIKKSDAMRLNGELGLHPALKPLAALYKEGKLAIVQGVGYPEPDRSHFRSMEIWHTASTSNVPKTTGWLGRLLDEKTAGKKPGNVDVGSLVGVALTEALPQALQAEHDAAAVVQSLDSAEDAGISAASAEAIRQLSQPTGMSGAAAFIGQQAETSFQIRKRLAEANRRYRSSVQYPDNELGTQLRRAAQIIAGNLGTRVLFVSQGGYDTHAAQADQHGQLLGQLADAVFAFQQDLAGLKAADKVATMVFSEFGRRVDQNSSAGTDHGAASCMFVVGSRVQGGLLGSYPSLEKLGDGDLIFNTDFRRVYATLLDRWLAAPSAELLGEKFAHLPLLPEKPA